MKARLISREKTNNTPILMEGHDRVVDTTEETKKWFDLRPTFYGAIVKGIPSTRNPKSFRCMNGTVFYQFEVEELMEDSDES